MDQKDKELLLKDLCARLPYGVKCAVHDENYVLSGITSKLHNELYFKELDFKQCDGYVNIEYCKPYLFPLSSMTEEQREEYNSLRSIGVDEWGDITYFDTFENVDWCNKNHFDYRGLIPMGLAIDATGLDIY